MAITEYMAQRVAAILTNLTEVRGQLYKSAQGFVDDQVERFDKYKERIFLSPKQMKWLEDLHAEFCADQHDALPSGNGPELPEGTDEDDDFRGDGQASGGRDDLDDDVPF